jgi:PAS domain-containing protein
MKVPRPLGNVRGTSREQQAGRTVVIAARQLGVWEADVVSRRLTGDSIAAAFGLTDAQGPATIDQLIACVHPEDKIEVDNGIEQAIRDRTAFVAEFRTIWPDQSVHTIAARAMPIAGPAGRAARLVGALVDVTEVSRADEERRFLAARIATERELALDGILVVDRRGRVVSFNRRFGEMWRLPDVILHSRQDAALHGAMRDRVRNRAAFMGLVQYLSEHRGETSREEIELLDGRTFDRYSAPMRGADGAYMGRVWYFRDVTADRALCPFVRSMRACEQQDQGDGKPR